MKGYPAEHQIMLYMLSGNMSRATEALRQAPLGVALDSVLEYTYKCGHRISGKVIDAMVMVVKSDEKYRT